jgi:hypothetical protein
MIYHGGPLDGEAVYDELSGEPMEESDVQPEEIGHVDWPGAYHWNVDSRRYEWRSFKTPDAGNWKPYTGSD